MPLVLDAVVFLARRVGNGGNVDLVDLGDISDALEPKQIVDFFRQGIDRERGALEFVLQFLDAGVEVDRFVGRLVGRLLRDRRGDDQGRGQSQSDPGEHGNGNLLRSVIRSGGHLTTVGTTRSGIRARGPQPR
jgi:hypothetical protein